MFEYRASSVRRVAGIFVLASLLSVSGAAAQGPGHTDHGSGTGHVKHHDRSNPKAKPDRVKQSAAASGQAAAVAVARSQGQRIGAALRLARLTGVRGERLAPETQQRVQLALTGRDRSALAASLSPASNASAAREAGALAGALDGLLDDPSRLPAATTAYNRFIGRSSAEFLASPPAELLAVQAVLAPLAETAVRGGAASDLAAR